MVYEIGALTSADQEHLIVLTDEIATQALQRV